MKKIVLALVAILFLTGCLGKSEVNEEELTSAEIYYKNKVEYIGASSKVLNLLNNMMFSKWGSYFIEIDSNSEPYGLIIKYKEGPGLEKNRLDKDMLREATYLLALINNLSYVEIKGQDYEFKTSLKEANEFVGGDIKEYGQSLEKFKTLEKKFAYD